jgi:hypothetical protein
VLIPRYIPLRLSLHLVSLLLAAFAAAVMVRVYRQMRKPRSWDRDFNPGLREVHQHDISRESNVL